MKKKIRIISLVSLLLLSILSTQSVLASESVDDENDNGGYVADDTERLEVPFEHDGYSLTTKYDPRESNHLTDIRNQSNVGICWMYAAASTEEQFIATRYGRKFDVSELHGAVALSDCIKKVNKSQIEPGYYETGPNRGSTTAVAAQYITNWNTPIFYNDVHKWCSNISEAEYPLSIMQTFYNKHHNWIEIKDDGDAFTDSKSLFNLTGFRYISKDMDNIKYAIQNYGAVSAGIHYDSNMVKNVNGNEQTLNNVSRNHANHSITIVGWDDDFSKDNFRNGFKPEGNGAWLVKNSWGYQDIRSGYMWISYEDGSLEASDNYFSVTTGVQPADESEYMLSYDYLPIVSHSESDKIFKDRVLLANVYDVSSFTDTYDCINKVMLYLKAIDCTYNIRIIPLQDNSVPTNVNDYQVLSSGTYSGEGYFTVTLSKPFEFSSGDKCAVIVEIIPNGSNSKIYIPYEGSYNAARGISSGESYYCFDSGSNLKWQDAAANDVYGNFCIRPVLKDTDSKDYSVSIFPNAVTNTDEDVAVSYVSDYELFNISNSDNRVLYQDTDYEINDCTVTLKKEYLTSLNGRYQELYFRFNNNIVKTVVINPKSKISKVSIDGVPIVGKTLNATCIGNPIKDSYNVSYQWQSSVNGNNWYDISGAVKSSYEVTDNDFGRYIRVKITAKKYGNVVYPTTVYSEPTSIKAVILGDVDLNGSITITDATMIQKYIVNLITFSEEQKVAADVDMDGNINTNDATELQKRIFNVS